MPKGVGPTQAISKLSQLSQASNQLQLPDFPKLSEHAPRLAQIDPAGLRSYEAAIEKFIKNSTFNIQKLPST